MNDLRKPIQTCVLSTGVLLLLSTASLNAADGFAISCEASKVTINYNGMLVTNYLFRDDAAKKPYFWPVIGPTGKPMTRAFPNNDYLDSSGKQLMADHRSMIFQMSDGNLILDFNITLLAKYGDVELEDKKDAGLNVRVPTSMSLKDGEGHIINSVGDRDGDTWAKSAAWVDYHGPVQGEHLGIAFLNHPSSFRHPTRWHVRDYGLFTANPFGPKSLDKTAQSGTFTLKNGESVHLRHRIIIHEGDEKTAGIEEAYRTYAASNETDR